MSEPFWRTKSLEEMNPEEWESLCDGCGRCCLNKIEYADTGELAWTDIACTLLDHGTCQCRNYHRRTEIVPNCVPLTPATVRELTWLPPSCAYRLVRDGRDLFWWHPLKSGDPNTVHEAGISVRGRVISEDGVDVDDYEERIVEWPDDLGDVADKTKG
ncbi:YcgN family cysteine cluster protein [Acuticoccus kandeliae]|uniref:YcgN family cysteine cluster protein n=1 Tax=Acuticoccus kandeliae TaxID=2073160 RepID=UPI000D3EDC42|nr:YcgN family cysteine cluster protein [Acuticoccus kandeliae]